MDVEVRFGYRERVVDWVAGEMEPERESGGAGRLPI